MKKILLATTVLVAGASVAGAEVTLSGDARMGIAKAATLNSDAQFSSRARLKFTMSGETDNGLSFGASFRADKASEAANGSAGSVFISGAFGKLEMGDVDSAAEAAVGHVAGVGYTGLGDPNEINYIGAGATANDPVVMLYTYASGDFTVNLSANDSAASATQSYGIGGSYTMGDYKIAAGYEDGGADSKSYLGVSGTFGAIEAKFVAAGQSSDVATRDGNEYALSVVYTTGAIAVTGFYKSDDRPTVAVVSYGLGASYDLGGGAKLVGGLAADDAAGNDTAYDLGVSFSF
jgi:outer membrane protein OmpU